MISHGSPRPHQATLPVEGPIVAPDLSKRYLTILAQAADQLLAAKDSAAMVEELFQLIQDELRLDAFFNFRFDGERLLLEASAGLTDEQAALCATLELGDAVCGCVARDREREHVMAIQTSDDPRVAIVKEVGLDAYACTPLLYGEELLGTLSFGRRWSESFTAEELQLLYTLCHYVALAKYRLRAEAALRDGIATRDRLLSELNHRVRNSLQVAVAAVRDELRGLEDDTARAAIERAADRVQLVAAAHRNLYQGDHINDVALASLLDEVGEMATGGPVDIASDAGVSLPVEHAVALSLLLHTLLCGHGRSAKAIHVTSTEAETLIRLTLADRAHAQAIAPDRFASALLKQLRARLSIDGASVDLVVPTSRDR